MKTNLGLVDRIIRVVLAVVVAVLIFTGRIGGSAAVVLGVLALILLVTSAVSFCPLYLPFGISTKKKE